MSRAKKPRDADVARWVEALRKPFPPRHGYARDRYWRDQDIATMRLEAWGLGPNGLPKVKAVTS